MRLDDQRESSNIENRRGQGRGFGLGGGRQQAGGVGGGGLLNLLLPLIGSKFGIVGIVVVVGGMMLFNCVGGNMGGVSMNAPQMTADSRASGSGAYTESADKFVAKVLGSTEDTWGKLFAQAGQTYPAPTLVLFRDGVSSACGSASSASGPFYCPGDQKVYLDTSFFDQLSQQFGAPGDFAGAYVIAHEVGHHIQTVLGTSAEIQQLRRRANQTESNQLSVRQELQADCYAGVWAAHNRHLLDSGDFAEGVRAAQAIGDDTLQHQSQGRVVPDSFTHGTSDQRIRWLTKGFESADPNVCDTYSQPYKQL